MKNGIITGWGNPTPIIFPMDKKMKIAIASGKGGTGKTMVAANLAFTLSQTDQVTLVDCDVEEPNLHLFFPAPATVTEVNVTGTGY